MKVLELYKIDKLYFGHEQIARVLGITLNSAKVSANRYAKKGILIRLKRNVYVLKSKWDNLTKEEKFVLANIIQVPSYISLMTALDYYEITTQIQRDFFESVARKRTKEVIIENSVFTFTKIKSGLYCDFIKRNDFFIAIPEKALLDAIYLSSFGAYRFDRASIDIGKLNPVKLKNIADKYPPKTKLILENEYSAKT